MHLQCILVEGEAPCTFTTKRNDVGTWLCYNDCFLREWRPAPVRLHSRHRDITRIPVRSRYVYSLLRQSSAQGGSIGLPRRLLSIYILSAPCQSSDVTFVLYHTQCQTTTKLSALEAENVMACRLPGVQRAHKSFPGWPSWPAQDKYR